VAGLAVLSASDATAQPSAKPSDAEICLAANESLVKELADEQEIEHSRRIGRCWQGACAG
jgi:hypothetical protein